MNSSKLRKAPENKRNRFQRFSHFSSVGGEGLNPENQMQKQKKIVLDARPGFFLTTPTLRLRVVRKKPGLESVKYGGLGGGL